MPYVTFNPDGLIAKAMFDFDFYGIQNFKFSGTIKVSVSDGFSNIDYYLGLVNDSDYTMDPYSNEIIWDAAVINNLNETFSIFSKFANLTFLPVVNHDLSGGGFLSICSPADVGFLSDINISYMNASSKDLLGASSLSTDRLGYLGSQGDIYINVTGNSFSLEGVTFSDYSKSRQVLIHEIGHSLGLSHPFDQYGNIKSDFSGLTAVGFEKLGFKINDAGALNKEYFSVMSYHEESSLANNNAFTPMIIDIIALDSVYGTGLGTTGINNDTIIAGNRGFRSYFDLGGTDLIDLSIYTNGAYLHMGTSIKSASHQVGVITSLSDSEKIFSGEDPSALRWLYGEYEDTKGSDASDLIIGNNLANTIHGNAGNDTLDGGAGNDTLDGGEGIDTLVGGAGNDTYLVDSTTDTITELANAGTDLVQSSVTYTLGTNLENLTLTGTTAINGAGNTLANTIIGNGAANTLNGSSGNDTLDGGIGAVVDIIDGGTGIDTVSYASLTSTLLIGVTLNLGDVKDLKGYVSASGLGGVDKVKGVENILGSAYADIFTGDSAANTLNGGAGNDTLNGGTGADTMTGGAGNDAYFVDAAGDVIIESVSDNTLDQLIFSMGHDNDVVIASVSYTLAADVAVEDMMAAGSLTGVSTNDVINLTGNDLSQGLIGNDAVNTLTGNGGNDILVGMGGNDTLIGGSGDDGFWGGTGDDSMSGGLGIDFFLFNYGSASGSNFVGQQGSIFLTGGNDTIDGGEGNEDTIILTGSLSDYTLTKVNATDYKISAKALLVGATVLETATFKNVEWLGFISSLDDLDNGSATVTLISSLPIGSAANDTLNGGTGNDILDGGLGVDVMWGGAGNDVYYVDNAKDQTNEAISATVTTDAGGNDLVYSSVTRTLGKYLENLTLTGSVAINGTGNTLANTIIGNGAANTLNGSSGNDTLDGGIGAAADIIDGGTGIDTVSYASLTSSLLIGVTLNLGGAKDANGYVSSSGLGGVDKVKGVENILGSAYADTLTGDSTANTLNGGEGDDGLDGGAGNDALNGGNGNDRYQLTQLTGGDDTITDSGGSADVVVVNQGSSSNTYIDVSRGGLSTTNANLIVKVYQDGLLKQTTTVVGQFSNTASTATTISGTAPTSAIEGIYSADDDQYVKIVDGLTGTASDELIVGTDGANTLTGNAGIDFMFGGAGNDTLNGEGDDLLDGGAGSDWADYSNATSFVSVNLATGTSRQGDFGIDGVGKLSNIEYVKGSSYNDNLTGNSGANILSGGDGNDLLDGGDGDDTLIGGTGSDGLDGGVGFDLADYSNSTGPVNVNLETGITSGWDGRDGLGNIECVIGSSKNDILKGDANINVLRGGLGNDILDGGAGSDWADYRDKTTAVEVTLQESFNSIVYVSGVAEDTIKNIENIFGGNGADQLTGDSAANHLSGGDGDDTLSGGTGNDTLDGGAGSDWADYSNATSFVSVNLATGTSRQGDYFGIDGVGKLSNIEYVKGSSYNDNLTGNSGANILSGGAGNDTLNGGTGADTMTGGAGNDAYFVDAAGDVIIESVSDNTLDQLTFSVGHDNDFVIASVSYTLAANVAVEDMMAAGSLTGVSTNDAINLTGNDLGQGLIGNDAVNTLTGNGGNDILVGMGGKDTLIGGSGDDGFWGGTGDDSMSGGLGIDFFLFNYGSASGSIFVGQQGSIFLTGGNDTIDGGEGSEDTIILTGSLSDYTLTKVNATDYKILAKALLVGATVLETATFKNVERLGFISSLDDLDNGSATVTLISSLPIGSAANDTLNGGAGNDILDGSLGVDVMWGGAGNDVYYVDNAKDQTNEAISATVTTDAGGNDLVYSSVTRTLGKYLENLTLTGTVAINGTGNTLANTIIGNGAANTLNGSSGNDTLIGGMGNDTLSGGTGSDVFVFNSATANNLDTILDFATGTDKIQLSKSIFAKLGEIGNLTENAFWSAAGADKGIDANDRVVYNTTTGALYYDADGSKSGAAVQIALLGTSSHPTAAFTDFAVIA